MGKIGIGVGLLVQTKAMNKFKRYEQIDSENQRIGVTDSAVRQISKVTPWLVTW